MKNASFILVFLITGYFSQAQTKDSTVSAFDTLHNNLKNVVITNQKPLIERQLDKMVLNVQNDINAAGSTLFEILQKAPGISIINDENINMSGKSGVLVLIDGKPTQMSQRDLSIFLKATPGSVVDKIEIITSPGSKYDAQGNAGIINIRLKKNKMLGTNGNISLGYTQQIHYRKNAGIGLNHRQGKLNIFGNFNIGDNLQHTKGTVYRIVPGTTPKVFDNNTTDIDPYQTQNFRTGLDYYLNKKSTVGLLVSGNDASNPFKTIGSTLIKSKGKTDSSLQTVNENFINTNRVNYNLNYKFEDTTGKELNIDADYSFFKNNADQQVLTNYFNDQFAKSGYSANKLLLNTKIDIYSIKADYAKQLKKRSAKMEAGIKYSQVIATNQLDAATWIGNQFRADTGRTNRFNYNETVIAGYGSYGRKFKTFEYQVGVRIEYSKVKGVSEDIRSFTINHPDTSYVNMFPTSFLRYTINEKNTLGLSFSKRINRPNYQDLNPFENIIDAYTSEKGNAYLKPSYAHNLELNYTYREALNLTLGLSKTIDYSQTITRQTGEKGFAQPQNVGSQKTWYLNVNLPVPIRKWWDLYTYLSFFYNQFQGRLPEGDISNGSAGFTWYISNSLNLGAGWKAQISSWGNGATKDALFSSKSIGSLDAGISKSILKNNGSLKLRVIDILNTQRWSQSVKYANQDFSLNRKWESQGVSLQFSWKFGKQTFSTRERNTASEDANGRIKEIACVCHLIVPGSY